MISTLSLILIFLYVCDGSSFRVPLHNSNYTGQQFSWASTVISSVRRNADKIKLPSDPPLLNSAFFCDVEIGTPPQKFEMFLKPSSNVTFVTSVVYIDSEALHKYDSTKSSTYENDSKIFIESSSTCTYKGIYGKDVVKMCGISMKPLEFVELQEISDKENHLTIDGSLGLSPGSPLLDAIWSSGSIENKIFSIYFTGKPFKVDGGEIIFGDIDTSHHDGPITYANLVNKKEWQIKLDGLSLGDFDACPDGCEGWIDISYPSLTGPLEEMKKINDKLNCKDRAHGMCYLDCDDLLKQPNLRVTIAGTVMELTPEEYILRFKSEETEQCLSTTFEEDWDLQNQFVIGVAFIRKYYTIFDDGKERIGFAKIKSSQ